jgi:photosystem II stability/assembly factor-like uncharacterized protein
VRRAWAAQPRLRVAFRQVRTQPVVFSMADKRALYSANNYLWKTVDGGINWKRISPDLTRATYPLPASIGKYTDPSLVSQRGVIYTIAPSYRDAARIWVGTDDGLITPARTAARIGRT